MRDSTLASARADLAGDRENAGIYGRISDDKENDEKGVRRQIKLGRKRAEDLGMQVVIETYDNDISATYGDPRPEYDRLMDAAEAGHIHVIIVYHLSRLWRNRRERAAGIERLQRARVSIVCVRGPTLDMSTAYGRAQAGLLGEFDTLEVEAKAERARDANDQAAREGRISNGGTRPYGYRRIFTEGPKPRIIRDEVDPDEAAIIREVVARVLAGETLRSILLDLRARDVRNSTGRHWSRQGMRLMLQSGRIAGFRTHYGKIAGKAVWPAIITEEQHHQLVAIIGGRSAGPVPRRHYLTGFVFGCCPPPMKVSAHSGSHSYVCRDIPEGGCHGRAISLHGLENMIDRYVVARLADPRLPREIAARRGSADTETARLIEQIDADERRIGLLRASLADGDEDEIPEVTDTIRAVRRRIKDTRRRLDQRTPVPTSVESAAGITLEEWRGLPLGAKRTILGFFVAKIIIGPGRRGANRFDPDRVDVVPVDAGQVTAVPIRSHRRT